MLFFAAHAAAAQPPATVSADSTDAAEADSAAAQPAAAHRRSRCGVSACAWKGLKGCVLSLLSSSAHAAAAQHPAAQ